MADGRFAAVGGVLMPIFADELIAEVRGLLALRHGHGDAPRTFTDAEIKAALTGTFAASPAPIIKAKLAAASATTGDVALGGADGKKADVLLTRARAAGAARLAELARRAVARLVAKGGHATRTKRLFDDAELAALADQIAATNAPAELLGRARIRERADRAEAARVAGRFHEEPTSFHAFKDPVVLAPMTPAKALEFFRGLVPKLGIDPERWGDELQRHAMTLAVAVDEVLIERVQTYLAEAIRTGQIQTAAADIDAILDAAGVGPRRAGYSEMVMRTNMQDAFNQGGQDELLQVGDTFPCYLYSNPNDGRSRPEHAEHDGKYYPSHVPFTRVRGTDIEDVANCRCSFVPIYFKDWQELREAGAKLEM